MVINTGYLNYRQRVKDQADMDVFSGQVEEMTGERPNFNEPPANALDTEEQAPSDISVAEEPVETLEEQLEEAPLLDETFIPLTPEEVQADGERVDAVMSFIKSVATQGQEITDPMSGAIREDLIEGGEEGFVESLIEAIPQTGADILEGFRLINKAARGLVLDEEEAARGVFPEGEIGPLQEAEQFLIELAGPKPEAVSSNVVREGAAFLIPFIGFTKLLKGGKAVKK